MRRISLVVLLAGGLFLGARPAEASKTVAVGNCRPQLKSFSMIQQAILSSTPGGIVQVCPGTYPEQVTISLPLTLEGIPSGSAGRSVIAVPPNGLSLNATSLFGGVSVAAQVLVTAGTPNVNIINITVDGSGNNINPPDFLVGIFYDSGSSGIVNRVTTRNQYAGGFGVGISTQNATGADEEVTIENSSIHDVDFFGILAIANPPSTLTANLKGNIVSSYDIGIWEQSGGAVTGNVISAGSDGIDLYNESTAWATGNTISNTQRGINVGTAVNVVKSNVVWNSSIAGITLAANGSTVEDNDVVLAPVGIEFGCYLSTVSGNRINDVGIGIDTVPSAFTLVNIFDNADTILTGC
jgi:hypothetical protein